MLVPGSAAWRACGAAYLDRFPEAEPMTRLDDFMFVAIHVSAARQVAGFGTARSIDKGEFAAVLSGGPDAGGQSFDE